MTDPTKEEERIFQGKLFDAHTEPLMQIKHRAHEVCRRFNAMDEYDPERQAFLRTILGGYGEEVYFQGPLQFNYGQHTFLGSHVFANFNLLVMDDGRIEIGNHVMIGPNVSLLATNHPLIAEERLRLVYPDGHCSMSEFSRGIVIEDEVWIAANVSVLDGVRIGRGAVIGAGSVVTRDIPAGWLAFGNPARPTSEQSPRRIPAWLSCRLRDLDLENFWSIFVAIMQQTATYHIENILFVNWTTRGSSVRIS